MTFRKFFLFFLITSNISACRYWSLYEFSDQFCAYDQHISVSLTRDEKQELSQIVFLDPVLPRNVLLRYLNALPTSSTYATSSTTQFLGSNTPLPSVRSDSFYIQRTQVESQPVYDLKLDYHLAGNTPLLSSAVLDGRLSTVFKPPLIEPILKSICSDDYDLNSKRLDMRFSLSEINRKSLPSMQDFEQLFGKADQSLTNKTGLIGMNYEFDFIRTFENKDQRYQHRPIKFSFEFSQNKELLELKILYYKYDYQLDFQNAKGRLIVTRN